MLPRYVVVPSNGPNEGAPEANVQRGKKRSSRNRQLRNKVNLPKFPVRYEPYPSARNRRAARNLRPPDWSTVPLPSYQRDFYTEHTRTAQRSSEEVDAYRNANEIIVTGRDVPKPILHVNEAGLSESLTKAIDKLNPDSSLTALQAQCWPVALSGRDVVAVDHTASKWKSLAYLVPALVHAKHQSSVLGDGGPAVVILTLTREAALQVRTAVQEFIKELGIRTMYILSGDAKPPQIKQLKKGADICVATPGRLTAFMEEGKVNLGRCTLLAMADVDRMLEMGFGKNLRVIADNIRPDRQTLVKLTCATKESWELAQKFTNNPVNISVGTATQEQQNKLVEHVVLICEKAKKVDKLVSLLKDILRDETGQTVVFVERQQTVEHLASVLRLQGWPAVGIHAKKTDQEHQEAFNALRSGKASVLVATDMATKPIELDRVRFVVSYDHPVHSSDYRRRYGHAVRLDGRGRTYTFLAPDDHVRARELMRFFRDNKLSLPPGLRKVANKMVRK
ncbi:putative ATP-dependent RNA helicase DDX5 [Rhipicephalus microplus]|uniref:putative ATP-dependent RNA helicase DDX5 n=1 Tax=Rhipicephalus microplus TaxID=6941 RepID=UPI003F6BD237